MYSLVRPYLNNVAIVEEDVQNHIGSTGFVVFESLLVNSTFFKYWLLSDFIRAYYLEFLSGFNSPGITVEVFLNTPFPLPPEETQNQIVDFLDNLKDGPTSIDKGLINPLLQKQFELLLQSQLNSESLTTELTHQQTLVKQLRQQLLQEAVQGKLSTDQPIPAESDLAKQYGKLWHTSGAELLAHIRTEKAKLIKEKKIKADKPLPPITEEEMPFELPEGWVWVRLGDIASIVRGGSPRPAGDKRYYDGSIPFLKVGDLTGSEDIYLDTYSHSIKEAGLQKTRLVEAGTLMLTNSGATLGIPRICSFATTFNDGIAAFLDILYIDKEYLFYFLKSKSKWYLDFASRGQGQPNLNTDIIAMTMFPLPPLQTQHRIVAQLAAYQGLCASLEAEIQESLTLNGALLQEVLREALSEK
jgi:type I restriction enzyme S subunit